MTGRREEGPVVESMRSQSEQRDRLQEALSRTASDLIDVWPPGAEALPYEKGLEKVTAAAVAHVPGADFVGLTMRAADGSLESHAPTSWEVAELDRLQAILGEGPCRDAVVEEGSTALVEVADFSTESRWPRFAPAAVERGALSLVSYAMAPHGAAPGAINFYSRERNGFDAASTIIAGAFAMQAGVAVYGAKRIMNLEYALQTRDVIGQAKGVLMERYRIGEMQAFARLVEASQDANMKLVDVARWLTHDTDAG